MLFRSVSLVAFLVGLFLFICLFVLFVFFSLLVSPSVRSEERRVGKERRYRGLVDP